MRCDETFFALNNTAHCNAVQHSTVSLWLQLIEFYLFIYKFFEICWFRIWLSAALRFYIEYKQDPACIFV